MQACVFMVLAVLGLCGCAEELDESGCIQMSKYDYDYKLLKQMVTIETENERLRGSIATAERILDEMSSRLDEIDELKRTLEMMTSAERTVDGIGCTYIRWGRPDCPENGTELIYSGNAVCMLSANTC